HEFHIWLYDDIPNKLPEHVIKRDANIVIPANQMFFYRKSSNFGHGKGSFAGFSDIFRYKLLYEYGGWWTDMDICCLKPLQIIQPYVFFYFFILHAVGNLMKCPKGAEIMKRCYESAIMEINEDNRDWLKPVRILNEQIRTFNLTDFIIEISNPDAWRFVRKMLFSKITIHENWMALHFINTDWIRYGIDKERFLSNSTVFGLMKKYGLNPQKFNAREALCTRLKLSWLCSGLLQVPSLIRNRLFQG
ncbi:MAG: hypothetical protein HY738_15235, partial [Bacteroidia bacterium]|nr:hypothetical protein [Bacteroidia bacterium]